LKGRIPLAGIMTAFKGEIAGLQAEFKIEFPSIDHGGIMFFRGILDDSYVVAAVSGMGMTNAAMATQAMIDLFHPKNLLITGIAGGINPSNVIGTVIFPRRVGEYKYEKSVRSDTNSSGLLLDTFFDNAVDFPSIFFKYDNDKVISFDRPSCAGCSNHNLASNTIIRSTVKTSYMNIPMLVDTFTNPTDAFEPIPPSRFFFNTDPHLLRLAKELINTGIKLPKQIEVTPQESYTPPIIIGDFSGSASTFLDNAISRKLLFNEFKKANVIFEFVDMESAGCAHCAVSNSVPFIVIKSLSDLAGGNASDQVINFSKVAAENSIFVTRQLIREIHKSDI